MCVHGLSKYCVCLQFSWGWICLVRNEGCTPFSLNYYHYFIWHCATSLIPGEGERSKLTGRKEIPFRLWCERGVWQLFHFGDRIFPREGLRWKMENMEQDLEGSALKTRPHNEYSWPLSSSGVGAPTLLTVGNPRIIYGRSSVSMVPWFHILGCNQPRTK